MRVVIAPDKFKGCLSAGAVAKAMALGVARAGGTPMEVVLVPMADGGEGTVDALVEATAGTYREAKVHGPLGEPRSARYGWLETGPTAVFEMAAASGLVLVPPDHRDPTRTSTFGTGEMLLDAARAGAKRMILGIGGSATNDGGAGFAQALGYRLMDDAGDELPPGGGALERLARIVPPAGRHELAGVELLVACDVDNPLCGPRGASMIFGPQKGATPRMVVQLDRNLEHFARIIHRDLGRDVRALPGAGAAGGLGAGLVAFAGARLRPGIDLVVEAVGLMNRLNGSTLCLTGEGSLDLSSVGGKTAVGVARLARRFGVPTIALAGSIGPGMDRLHAEGLTAFFSICPGPMGLDEAIRRAPELIEAAAEQAVRAFLARRSAYVNR